MKSIERVEQVFPEELLTLVQEQITNAPWRYGWGSNKNIEFTHWNHSFVRAGAQNGLDMAHELNPVMQRAWQHVQEHITGPAALLRCYTNTHTFGVEGYPHTDSKRQHDRTLVVYMTPHWQRDWGGETVVYDGYNIAHAELPRYNHGLIFNGNQWHQARSVTRICPAQRTTLMFKYAPRDVDVHRDRIQLALTAVGANKIKHSGRNLMVHLLNVYDILKSWGYDQTVCSAGGAHSIFGTNVFKHKTATSEDRPRVVQVIGEEATQLVELFRDIRRPRALEAAVAANSTTVELNDGTTRELTVEQLNNLCAIEAANLTDQKGLKNYPHLRKFARTGNIPQ